MPRLPKERRENLYGVQAKAIQSHDPLRPLCFSRSTGSVSVLLRPLQLSGAGLFSAGACLVCFFIPVYIVLLKTQAHSPKTRWALVTPSWAVCIWKYCTSMTAVERYDLIKQSPRESFGQHMNITKFSHRCSLRSSAVGAGRASTKASLDTSISTIWSEWDRDRTQGKNGGSCVEEPHSDHAPSNAADDCPEQREPPFRQHCLRFPAQYHFDGSSRNSPSYDEKDLLVRPGPLETCLPFGPPHTSGCDAARFSRPVAIIRVMPYEQGKECVAFDRDAEPFFRTSRSFLYFPYSR